MPGGGGVGAGGLSPRVRGKQVPPPESAEWGGSIPACAGEAGTSGKRRPTPTVYPRVCGGSSSGLVARSANKGLSPRVRGKPLIRPI